MKTLFGYGSQLNSRDLNLALASLIGVGPICGFNEASIDGNILKLLSTNLGSNSGIYKPVMWDRVRSRFINQLESGGHSAQILHGCIARDGSLYLDDNQNISVSILNDKVTFNEVLLFAQHISVADPIENPVNLVAFFNTTSDSFYTKFYLPSISGDLSKLYNTDIDNTVSFSRLESLAFSSIPSGNVSLENSVLVGIYGTGINQNSSSIEKFSIVPYNSQFPTKLEYNVLVHKYLMDLGNRVSRLESK